MLFAAGCASVLEEPAEMLEANPGEAEVDILWREGNVEEAAQMTLDAAEQGYPWAQLRMGIFLSQGEGIEEDDAAAVEWLQKAAEQFAEQDGMGRGLAMLVGLSKPRGFFRQWDDALAARFFLAQHFRDGAGVDHDIVRAWLLAEDVRKLSDFQMIEACDIDSETLYREVHHAWCAITQVEIRDLMHSIEEQMTEQELTTAREQSGTWEYAPQR